MKADYPPSKHTQWKTTHISTLESPQAISKNKSLLENNVPFSVNL
jgi:hypothetical protein